MEQGYSSGASESINMNCIWGLGEKNIFFCPFALLICGPKPFHPMQGQIWRYTVHHGHTTEGFVWKRASQKKWTRICVVFFFVFHRKCPTNQMAAEWLWNQYLRRKHPNKASACVCSSPVIKYWHSGFYENYRLWSKNRICGLQTCICFVEAVMTATRLC